jgi:histidine triad (HIT) family protein
METCVFCRILAHRSPASMVYEDEACAAFMDVNAINPGHTLVVPCQHAPGLADLDPEAGAAMFRLAQRLAHALRNSGLRCEGVNLMLADGEVAGQQVMHVHMHVLPRYPGDGFGFRHGFRQHPHRSDLDDMAARIASALSETKS